MRTFISSAGIPVADGFSCLFVFDPQTCSQPGNFGRGSGIKDPRGIRLDPTGKRLFVNNGDHRILALEVATGQLLQATAAIPNLDPGGGNFGPDGRYYVGSRQGGTIVSFDPDLNDAGQTFLPERAVPYPRGFAFSADGSLYLASGIGPDGLGENSIIRFRTDRLLNQTRLVSDPALSPLDLVIAPNGNVVVSSEFPFGSPESKATLREYDSDGGKLVRVFALPAEFRKPRGIRFDPDNRLYCTGADHVARFDFSTGHFLDFPFQLKRLNGQSIEFVLD